jgi:hypothetical protein
MASQHSWVVYAMLGVGYVLLGIALTVQAVAGPLIVRWSVILPAIVVTIGLLMLLSGLLASRRPHSGASR